jgi:hypothetical protein
MDSLDASCLYHCHLIRCRESLEEKLKDLGTVKREKKFIRWSDDTLGFRLAIPA